MSQLGLAPPASNTSHGSGGVCVRPHRRALRYGHKLGLSEPFMASLVPTVAQQSQIVASDTGAISPLAERQVSVCPRHGNWAIR